jgi:5-methylcytosine-specific restriction endonuclease McrA
MYTCVCKVCGNSFNHSQPNTVICSDACKQTMRDMAKKPKIHKQCYICAKPFATSKVNQKYCSPECSHVQLLENNRKTNAKNRGNKKQATKRFRIFLRDKFKCQYCGRTIKDNVILQIDHIIPRKHGGTFTEDNLITACNDCNYGKRDVLLNPSDLSYIKSLIEH